MPLLETIGGQAAGTAMGLILGKVNDERQRNQQNKLNKDQQYWDKQMTDYQFAKQLQMWKDTGYAAQVEQMTKAGINPALMYGMGGGGGQSIGGSAASTKGANAPSGGGEAMGGAAMGIQAGLQLAMMKAQLENINADTNKKNTEAQKTGGVDTDLAIEETKLKILDQVIQEYAGKEATRVYERIKKPNTGVEAKTWQDELEARQGIAGTIYEMWAEGKLREKSVAEIEQILLTNAKTRAEKMEIYKRMDLLEQNIKGAKLDNIIKDLEAKLQTQTGIDKSSPGWLKILGRLFVGLMGD